MPLTPERIEAVKNSWKNLSGDPTTNGLIWFKWMFESYPDMKNLYRFLQGVTDFDNCPQLAAHVKRVYKKVEVSIDQLQTRRILAADLKTLGSRHPQYGVIPSKHIKPTFEGLVYMVEKQSPPGSFTVDTRRAYEEAFNLICNCMNLFQ